MSVKDEKIAEQECLLNEAEDKLGEAITLAADTLQSLKNCQQENVRLLTANRELAKNLDDFDSANHEFSEKYISQRAEAVALRIQVDRLREELEFADERIHHMMEASVTNTTSNNTYNIGSAS